MPRGQKQEIVQIPAEDTELVMLRGFRDLVHEGIGYLLGARAIQSEASDATKDQRATANAARKAVNDGLEGWITESDIEGYKAAVATLTDARKVLSEAMKPHNTKKSPLTKAWNYCVNVAFPDSLKELNTPVQPTFSLSEWMKTAIEKKKEK